MSMLNALNPAQYEAAQVVDGPLLILAGAGSGKTRVLTYRISYLIQEIGVAPWNILAVTFTNKAAGEMRERVEHLVGNATRDIWIGTFHSICARLLRFEASAFGLDANFTIYDEEDRRTLMRRILKSLNIPEEDLAPRAAIAQISRAKNAMLDPQQFAQEASDHQRQIAEVYPVYEAALRQHNAFDFDDLLVVLVRQLQQHPNVLEKYQERFKYILVDEYQDTNRPQYLLTQQLAAKYRNICCVGDDDQSIYQFRGADIRNILDFERDYPEAKTVRLEQNYRSTASILAAANAVIQNNQNRKGKELWTQSEKGELIRLVECDSDRREARYVVESIQHLTRQEGLSLAEVAVLYRTNAQSRALEEELQRASIPYVIVGGTRFYERKEIKDLLAYLRLLVNPADDISLQRVINVPRRGIGSTSIERLQLYARQHGLGLFAALSTCDQAPGLNARARKSLQDFYDIILSLTKHMAEVELPALGEEVVTRTGYRQMLQEEDTPEAEARQQNIDQLLAFITEFAADSDNPTLASFLEETALLSPVDEAEDSGQTLTLMTLHSAKGLEYPAVFICGMEEQLFPTARAIEEARENPQAIEEERRLLYVGITRAEKQLILTYACSRYSYGSLQWTAPSRFLEEIPQDLLATSTAGADPRTRSTPAKNPISRPKKKTAPKGVHYEWEESPSTNHLDTEFSDAVDQEDFLSKGRWVLHPTWGRGQIVARDGSGTDMKLSIRFANNQLKRVAVAYAQLEPG
jgi:DNA helicase-2/ATP-dependent DNA helicase PcrA